MFNVGLMKAKNRPGIDYRNQKLWRESEVRENLESNLRQWTASNINRLIRQWFRQHHRGA